MNKKLAEMTLQDVEARIAELDQEVAGAESKETVEAAAEEKRQLLARRDELKDLEERKSAALKLNSGEAEGKVLERGKESGMTDEEKRAKVFAETGKTQMDARAILSSDTTLVKPTKADTSIKETSNVVSSIVDDVKAVALTGVGSYTVPYRKSDTEAKDVTDGSAVASQSNGEFDYVTINPGEWGVFDEVSNQVKKMSPVDYEASVKRNSYLALRRKAKSKIVTAVLASDLLETRKGVALDATYIRDIVLGFGGDESVEGGTKLYINKTDLGTLGKVRGTNEKKPVYDIEFTDENNGTIKDGGMMVRFSILSDLATGQQLYGQPQSIEMPMWDAMNIATDEGGEFFKKNMIGIRGLQTAGADLCKWHGMQLIKQATEQATE